MLIQLIASEIEGKPEVAARMKLAILPGFNVLVPQGKLVGGTLQDRRRSAAAPGETGCVMSWVSFRENNVPPAGACSALPTQPGMTVGCTNPARPGSPTGSRSTAIGMRARRCRSPAGRSPGRAKAPPPTPYLRTEGLVSARCVNDGPRGYLSIRTNADPNDKRTDRVGGEVGVLGFFLPGWGMHLADYRSAGRPACAIVGDISARSRTASQPAR